MRKNIYKLEKIKITDVWAFILIGTLIIGFLVYKILFTKEAIKTIP